MSDTFISVVFGIALGYLVIYWGASVSRYLLRRRGPRSSCILCACKHLAQACVLLNEMKLGYPAHYWIALGHMAEAEDELAQDYLDLARSVRAYRKELELYPLFDVPFELLILDIARSEGYDVEVLLKKTNPEGGSHDSV